MKLSRWLAIIGMAGLLGITLGCARAHKPAVLIPEGVPLRIKYDYKTCKREADQSVTCKANFSPFIVRTK